MSAGRLRPGSGADRVGGKAKVLRQRLGAGRLASALPARLRGPGSSCRSGELAGPFTVRLSGRERESSGSSVGAEGGQVQDARSVWGLAKVGSRGERGPGPREAQGRPWELPCPPLLPLLSRVLSTGRLLLRIPLAPLPPNLKASHPPRLTS